MMTIDTTQFQAALREHLLSTSRSLADAMNSRMSFLLMRAFMLTPPRDPQGKRDALRSALREIRSERTRVVARTGATRRLGRARQLIVADLVAQKRNTLAGKPGMLLGIKDPLNRSQILKAARAKVLRGANAVGYAKSVIIKALRGLHGRFSQFGGSTQKAGGKQIQPNPAMGQLAAEYGHTQTNIGIFKGAKASVRPAQEGWTPEVMVNMTLGVAEGQDSKTEGILTAAFQQAFDDETTEMRRHLEAVVQNEIDAVSA